MPLLRRLLTTLTLLTLAVYLGGMLALGAIAAPAIFRTVRQTAATLPHTSPLLDPSSQLGGEIFGNVLTSFQRVEWTCLILLAVFLVAELALYLRPRAGLLWGLVRTALLLAVAVIAIYDAAILTPDVFATRQRWRAAHDPLQAAVQKATFDRLHHRSEDLGHTRAYLLLALTALTAWGPPSLTSGKATPTTSTT